MFTTREEQSQGSYLKTGMASFILLGVNPTAAQIEEWTGRTGVEEPNYDLKDDYNKEHQVRQLNCYMRNDHGDVVVHRMEVSLDPKMSKSGNYQVCTSNGSITWAKAAGSSEVKPEFASHKPLRIGEENLINFIGRLVNFDYKDPDGNLYEEMTIAKTTVDELYAGKYGGINAVGKWCAENDKKIIMMMEVTEKEALDKDGNPTVKRYQNLSPKSETWFSGEVNEYVLEQIQKRYEASLIVASGATQAYPIIKGLFTYKYQDFVKGDCLGGVPSSNPTPPTGQGTWKTA